MDKIRILFISPKKGFPIEEHYNRGLHFTNSKQGPLELAYLAAMVPEHGRKVIDAHFFGLGNQEIADIVANQKPDLVVIPTTTIDRWECPPFDISYVFSLAVKIREKSDAKILVFGPHTTSTPDYVFNKCSAIDYTLRGEPELPFKNFVREFSQGNIFPSVSGLSFSKDGEIIHNPQSAPIEDLDSLPLPALELFPIEAYKKVWDKGLATPVIISSRGCPFNCIFCYKGMFGNPQSSLGDRYYREMSPKRTVELMEQWLKYGTEYISFNDWEFCLNKKRVYEICKEIKEKGLKVKWSVNTRFPDIDEPLLKAMKSAGLIELKLGLESGSPEIIKTIDKDLPLAEIPSKIKLMDSLGLRYFIYGLIGNPGESFQTLKESVHYSVSAGAGEGGGKIVVPYPGTRLFELAKKEYGEKINWDNLSSISGKVGTTLLKENSLTIVYAYIKFWVFVEKIKKIFSFLEKKEPEVLKPENTLIPKEKEVLKPENTLIPKEKEDKE